MSGSHCSVEGHHKLFKVANLHRPQIRSLDEPDPETPAGAPGGDGATPPS